MSDLETEDKTKTGEDTPNAEVEDAAQTAQPSADEVWYKDNLLILECSDVSWDEASDKIPLEMLRYILGDLLPHLQLGFTARSNRFYFDLGDFGNPSFLADVHTNMFKDRWREAKHDGFECHFNFELIGHKDPSVVDVMLKLKEGTPTKQVLNSDIFDAESFTPHDKPVNKYLPAHVVTSTPVKQAPAIVNRPPVAQSAATMGTPTIDQLSKDDLVRLAHQLLAAQASSIRIPVNTQPSALAQSTQPTPVPATQIAPPTAIPPVPQISAQPAPKIVTQPIPSIATVSPPVSLPQDDDLAGIDKSVLQYSQAMIKGLTDQGVIKNKLPKIDYFSGTKEKDKVSFRVWVKQVYAAEQDHSKAAMTQAVRSSLKGKALEMVSIFPSDTPWQTIVERLKVKFQDKASYDSLMRDFYAVSMEDDEDCTTYSNRLEQQLALVQAQFPAKLADNFWHLVRDRFFNGLPELLKANLREKFEKGSEYYDLLEAARTIESESRKPAKNEKGKGGKGKVSSVTIEDPVQKLEAAYKQTASQIAKMQTAIDHITQSLTTLGAAAPTTPTATLAQQLPTVTGNRGRGGFRGHGRGRGRGRGGGTQRPLKCYFCEGRVPDEQARHRVTECPLFQGARNSHWGQQAQAAPAAPGAGNVNPEN